VNDSTFALDLRRFGEKVNGNASRVVRGVALELLRGVVMDTPVDTGRARANWQTTVGSPALGDYDYKGGPGAAANEAISDGTQTIQAVEGDAAIFLTNNLPYIVLLEEGHSQQAPAGMVRKNIARFPFLVEQKAREANG
jgi:hypothetical protein